MGKDPISDREYFRTIFPDWVVDFVLAPYPDEVGRPLVAAKWLGVGWIACSLFDAVFGSVPQGVGAALIAVAACLLVAAQGPQ